MKRSTDASLSRINISSKKTVYVEGNLDEKIIIGILQNHNISNLSIVRITTVEETDDSLGAKDAIIDLIEKANSDDTVLKKYLGIIDQDYSYFANKIVTIDNLLYTDFNSMESYLIDIHLMNCFLSDHSENTLPNDYLDKKCIKFIYFSLFFYFQQNFPITINERLCFKKTKIDNPYFMFQKSRNIKVKKIITKRISHHETCRIKFIFFLKKMNLSDLKSNHRKFNHGKYCLSYLIGSIKKLERPISKYKEESIINILKDKLIISKKYLEYKLFIEIIKFSGEKTENLTSQNLLGERVGEI